MKLAFSSNAYKNYDLLWAIDSIGQIGYSGIEIMADIPHAYPPNLNGFQRKTIKTRLQANNLELANLNAFMLCALGDFWHPSFIETDKEDRRKRINHTLNCIDLAADLGAPSISIEPGGPVQNVSVNWALNVFQEAVEEILEYAHKKNIYLLIEPEPELLIENSKQFVSFIEKINSPLLGLNFDIGHFFCVGEDLVELIKTLEPYTKHYHLEDIAINRVHQHLLPGVGAIDFYSVLEAIASTGYQDFITIELYPYAKEPELAAQKANQYIWPILDSIRQRPDDRPVK